MQLPHGVDGIGLFPAVVFGRTVRPSGGMSIIQTWGAGGGEERHAIPSTSSTCNGRVAHNQRKRLRFFQAIFRLDHDDRGLVLPMPHRDRRVSSNMDRRFAQLSVPNNTQAHV